MKRLLALALLAACGKSADECRTEATQLGDLLEQAAQEFPPPFSVVDDIHLVSRTDLPNAELHRAPVVMLSPQQIKFQDAEWDATATSVADVATLERQLHDANVKIHADFDSGKLAPRWYPEPNLVHLVIDRATPWERVAEVHAAAIRAGFTVPAFVFERPQSVKPPPRSALDKQLDEIEHGNAASKATKLAELISKRIKNCPALIKAFGSVAATEGMNKALYIAQEVKPALVSCKCDVDVPELRSALFRIMYVPHPLRAIQLDPAAPRQHIELPKATTWADASKRFTPTLKNAELVAN